MFDKTEMMSSCDAEDKDTQDHDMSEKDESSEDPDSDSSSDFDSSGIFLTILICLFFYLFCFFRMG